MIKWQDKFNTGVENLDAQHRRLFAIANEAYGLLKNDLRVDKYDDIVAILTELRDYTQYHFQTEEEYMLSIGYKKFPFPQGRTRRLHRQDRRGGSRQGGRQSGRVLAGHPRFHLHLDHRTYSGAGQAVRDALRNRLRGKKAIFWAGL